MKRISFIILLFFATCILQAQTNVTTIGGYQNYITKFSGTSTIVNSSIFDNGTNIGIGTNAPACKLNLLDAKVAAYSPTAIPTSSFRLDNYNNSGANLQYSSLGFQVKGTTGGNTAVGALTYLQLLNANRGGAFAFTLRNDVGSYNEIMRIQSDGNVGIGITTPSAKLHVVGNSYFNGNLGIGTSTPSTCLSIKSPNNQDILTIETSDYPTWNPTWKLNYMDGHLLFKFSENGGAFINTFSISRFGDIGLVCPGTNRRIDISSSSQEINIWDDNNIKKVSINTAAVLFSQKIEVRTNLDQPGTVVMKVTNDGKIWAQEVVVQASDPWPDFVFDNNYKTMPLNELEKFVKENNHLPNVPSACEVSENGVNLAKMDANLLQKIEELTLYVIDLNKKIEVLQAENKELKNK